MRFLLITVSLIFLLSTAVRAQNRLICGDRDNIVKTLNEKYSEFVVGRGFGNNNQMIEIFASENGSYTILTTKPEGYSCLISGGENWRSIIPEKPMDGPKT